MVGIATIASYVVLVLISLPGWPISLLKSKESAHFRMLPKSPKPVTTKKEIHNEKEDHFDHSGMFILFNRIGRRG